MYASVPVVLNPSYPNLNVNSIAPVTLSIDPRLVDPNKKVYKIVYNFGDGSEPLVKKLAGKPLESDISLPYYSEILDPRNFKIEHEYLLSEKSEQTFLINVKVYSVMSSTVTDNFTEYTISLKVTAPVLHTINNTKSDKNFFEDVHLLSTRMFGPDNTILYNFESVDPQYLMPTIVKWHQPYNETNKPPFVYDPINSPR
jgi:hypothetical protein